MLCAVSYLEIFNAFSYCNLIQIRSFAYYLLTVCVSVYVCVSLSVCVCVFLQFYCWLVLDLTQRDTLTNCNSVLLLATAIYNYITFHSPIYNYISFYNLQLLFTQQSTIKVYFATYNYIKLCLKLTITV